MQTFLILEKKYAFYFGVTKSKTCWIYKNNVFVNWEKYKVSWFLMFYSGILWHSYFPSHGISERKGSSWSGAKWVKIVLIGIASSCVQLWLLAQEADGRPGPVWPRHRVHGGGSDVVHLNLGLKCSRAYKLHFYGQRSEGQFPSGHLLNGLYFAMLRGLNQGIFLKKLLN